ncbi:MAG: hypothetical protein IPG48_18790 [Saprospiraceae bacterium]|nr:hypothetical protein [Saprospiraceae bacterium]
MNAGHIAYDPSDISTLKISFYLNTMNGKPLEQSPKPLTIKIKKIPIAGKVKR